MKKSLIIAGIIVIIIIIAWLAMNPSTDSQQQLANQESDLPVTPVEIGDEMMQQEEAESMSDSMAETATYQVNTESSSLGWYAAKKIGNEHNGEVAIRSGSLSTDENGALSSGIFIIDMSTITDENQQGADDSMVVKHLSSSDFFEVETYPESVFEITSISDNGGGTYNITGDLTIKDVTNEISFPAQISMSNGQLNAEAEFSIDRADWNLNWGDGDFFDGIGDKILKDDIDFTINLIAEK